MKKIIILISILIFIIFISSTSYFTNSIETLKSENTKMVTELNQTKEENKSLKSELEEIKFGASNLIKEIETSYKAKLYDKAISEIDILIQKHPTSTEAEKAKEIKLAIEKIKEQESKVQQAELKKKMDEEKKRLEQATSKMRKKVDEVQGITWYYDKTTSSYNNVNSFHTYIGERASGSPWLRLRIQYAGDNWLFIDNYKFLIDGRNYEITPVEVERDNNADVWEWYDTDADKSNIDIIKAIIESDKAVVRYEGKQYYKDRTITSAEKKALQNVLDAFKALGGNI